MDSIARSGLSLGKSLRPGLRISLGHQAAEEADQTSYGEIPELRNWERCAYESQRFRKWDRQNPMLAVTQNRPFRPPAKALVERVDASGWRKLQTLTKIGM